VIDLPPELELLGSLVGVVMVGVYLLVRYPVPIRRAMAIFGVGTAILAFLAYRWYQSHVDYCKGSPEVATGGGKLSCLEPQHWFAFYAANFVLLLAELAVAAILTVGLVNWGKQRRSPPRAPAKCRLDRY
jgi:hypothetical protein